MNSIADVAAGPQPREPDHLLREIDDLDRLAHVQHEERKQPRRKLRRRADTS